jgi:hypothetical protein
VPPLPSFLSTSSSNRRRVKASCARRALHPRPEGRSFPRNKDKEAAAPVSRLLKRRRIVGDTIALGSKRSHRAGVLADGRNPRTEQAHHRRQNASELHTIVGTHDLVGSCLSPRRLSDCYHPQIDPQRRHNRQAVAAHHGCRKIPHPQGVTVPAETEKASHICGKPLAFEERKPPSFRAKI